jgi:hypothetical protein
MVSPSAPTGTRNIPLVRREAERGSASPRLAANRTARTYASEIIAFRFSKILHFFS